MSNIPIPDLFLYTFLAIFVSLAVLTVGSLPGWIKIPETYRKKLFATLVLQVIGCVVLFAKQTFDAKNKPINPIEDRGAYLDLLTTHPWEWHYSPLNWVTYAHFRKDGKNAISFEAETFVKCDRKGVESNVKIYSWKSEAPISSPRPGENMSIPCTQIIFPAVSDVVSPTSRPAGTYHLTVQLHLSKALVGDYSIMDDKQGPITGGMVFTQR